MESKCGTAATTGKSERRCSRSKRWSGRLMWDLFDSQGKTFQSGDGLRWELGKNTVTVRLFGLAPSDRGVYAFGEHEAILFSSDGLTWSVQQGDVTSDIPLSGG